MRTGEAPGTRMLAVQEVSASTTLASRLLVGAAFTSTWTAVTIGGLKPVDLFLLLAFAMLVPSLVERLRSVPGWMVVGTAGLLLVMTAHQVVPTAADYFSTRFEPENLVVDPNAAFQSESGLAVGIQWLVALAALPLMVWVEAQRSPGLARRLVVAFAAGAGISALVAVTDSAGFTAIGPSLLGYTGLGGRESGLTDHPNNFGFACVIAVPLACYLVRVGRRSAGALVVLLGIGTLLSGSRGAQAGLVVAFVTVAMVTPHVRRAVPKVLFLVAVLLTFVAALAPHAFAPWVSFVRFGASDTLESDAARVTIARQAEGDFLHDPAFGVGLEVLVDAHSVYLQLLAAGGVVLFLSFGVYWLGALRAGWRVRGTEVVAPYLIASMVTWMVMGVVQNQLTERYLYVLVAAIAALVAVQSDNPAVCADSARPCRPLQNRRA